MILALGTAQLGLDYGINNTTGGLTDAEADALLVAAVDAGFMMLDTSACYGLAFERIGRFLKRRPDMLQVIAKFHAALPPETLLEQFERCWDMIGDPYATMLWTSGQDVATLNPNLADGVSVYTVEDARAIPEGFSLAQVPASILDQRMDTEIMQLQARGVAVAVRSLLVQGLLAADPETGPVDTYGTPGLWFQAKPYIDGLRAIVDQYRLDDVIELAVRWAHVIQPDIAIYGAETPEQVRDIARWFKRGQLPIAVRLAVFALRQGIPEIVISPRMWNQHPKFTMGDSDGSA